MRVWRVAVLGLVACGRLGFDTSARDASPVDGVDAPAGHDEDGDGIPDVADGCPHIADPLQPDGDGDGVDDACDPRPAVTGDSIALFDPFVSLDPAWSYFGQTPVVENDSMSITASSTFFGLRREVPIGDDVFAIGGHVGAGLGGGRQLTISAYENTMAHYYCELYDGGSAPHFAETWTYDDVTYQSDALVPAQGPIENADLTLLLEHRGTVVGCETSYPTDSRAISATEPPALTPIGVAITAGYLDVRVDYFLQIHSE